MSTEMMSQSSNPPHPSEMTDREIAEETLIWLRMAGATLAQLQSGGMSAMMGQMMRGMMGKKG